MRSVTPTRLRATTIASGSTRLSAEGADITAEPTAALIADELDAEREVRRSLEQRALSLFASAGVIGSLAGIAGGSKRIGTGPQVLLALALVALAAGALYGLRVAWPRLVEEPLDSDELAQAVDNDADWGQETDKHLRRASRARIRVTKNARQLNNLKAEKLRHGIWCAGAGIAFLLIAVVWVTIDAALPS